MGGEPDRRAGYASKALGSRKGMGFEYSATRQNIEVIMKSRAYDIRELDYEARVDLLRSLKPGYKIPDWLPCMEHECLVISADGHARCAPYSWIESKSTGYDLYSVEVVVSREFNFKLRAPNEVIIDGVLYRRVPQ